MNGGSVRRRLHRWTRRFDSECANLSLRRCVWKRRDLHQRRGTAPACTHGPRARPQPDRTSCASVAGRQGLGSERDPQRTMSTVPAQMTSNGAEALIRTLVGAGVDTCFTNPGTSEIHLVAALDAVPELRAILTLFEGVATGAADGYARMTGGPPRPSFISEPGLGQRRGQPPQRASRAVPLLNIVGDHATYHTQYDSPLQSDIETLARNVSTWVRTSVGAESVALDALEAIVAANGPPGQVATLIVPADVSWHPDGIEPRRRDPRGAPPVVRAERVEAVARRSAAARPPAFCLEAECCASAESSPRPRIAVSHRRARVRRDGARPNRARRRPARRRTTRVLAQAGLGTAGGARGPHPGRRSSRPSRGLPTRASAARWRPTPAGCTSSRRRTSDVVGGLEALVEALGAADATPVTQARVATPRPEGPLTAEKVCQMVGATLPEGAILSDEAITSAAALPASTVGGPRHDWLTLTGGAIGQGLPVAVGAAIACPDRPVIALQADGSALYTIQSLWTMAREQLDVTVVIFNNRGYRILDTELGSLEGVEIGPSAGALVDLANPTLDFVKLEQRAGRGVAPGRHRRATRRRAGWGAGADPGPHLIEAIFPRTLIALQAAGRTSWRVSRVGGGRVASRGTAGRARSPGRSVWKCSGPGGERRRHGDRAGPRADHDTCLARALPEGGHCSGISLASLEGELDGGHRPHAPAHLRDEFVVGERRERVEQRLLLLAPTLQQAVALEQFDIRQRGGAARWVPAVGGAVAEDRSLRARARMARQPARRPSRRPAGR